MAEVIKHISEKVWSAYKESDYTLSQWHDACLIHQHEGGDYIKADCKLPVRTPNGALNRNGVHAAWAALAGARGGVNASEEEKSKAAKTLIGMYKQLSDDIPPKMNIMAQSTDFVSEFLSHHGIKGMKWGIRKSRKGVKAARKALPSKVHDEHLTVKKIKSKGSAAASNEELKKANERDRLVSEFSRNNPGKIQRGHNHVKAIMGIAGTASTVYAFTKSPLGQRLVGKAMTKSGKRIVVKAGQSFI